MSNWEGTIEELTSEERDALFAPDDFPPTWVTDKAIRIIDQLTEALAAAETESGKNAYSCRRAVERAEAAEALAEAERQNCCDLIEQKACAEARVRELEAEAERLREKLGLTERTALTAIRTADRECDRAESELAQLRGELACWEAAGEKAAAQTNELLGMAERGQWYLRQLAAANALLERWRGRAWRLKGEKELKAATEAHLAWQAAPDPGEYTRAEAEQRVLDAAAAWFDRLRVERTEVKAFWLDETKALHDAELARRGLK